MPCFPTRWHSATKFGVHPVKFALRNELFNRVNQVLISIIMASFCGINRINKISSFTGDENVFFRVDSGFFSGELFNLLESYGWDYLVKVKLKNLDAHKRNERYCHL